MSIVYQGSLEDLIWRLGSGLNRVCYNQEIIVWGSDHFLIVFHETIRKEWKCKERITCIAVAETQIIVGTSNGVFVLHCTVEDDILWVKQKSKIEIPSSITQIRTWNKDEITECFIFTKSQAYSLKWNITTIKTIIDEAQRVPGEWSKELLGSGTLDCSLFKSDDEYPFLDGVRIRPKGSKDEKLFVAIHESRSSVKVTIASHPTLIIREPVAEFHLLDISLDGYVLLQNISACKAILIKGEKVRKFDLGRTYTSGRFLSKSPDGVFFVLQSFQPPMLALYVSKKNEFKCLHSWASNEQEDVICRQLPNSIAVYGNRIATIWHDRSNLLSTVQIFKISDGEREFGTYYKPKGVKEERSKSRIVDSAFSRDSEDPEGALLWSNDGTCGIHYWISKDGTLYNVDVAFDEVTPHSMIAIQRGLLAVCTPLLDHFFIRFWDTDIQSWDTDIHCFSNETTVKSQGLSEWKGVLRFVSLNSGLFCLAGGDALLILNSAGPPEDPYILAHEVHDIRYNPAENIVRVLHQDDEGLFLVADYNPKERQTRAGRCIRYEDLPFLDPDGNVHPDGPKGDQGHLCGGGELIVHHQGKKSNVVALYNLDSSALIWSLDWDGKEIESVYKDGSSFFLVTKSSLSVISKEKDEVVERILLGNRKTPGRRSHRTGQNDGRTKGR